MKEIVVLSGKGGTGKTSITAALALLAGQDAVIADCDVDAANMHLLLQPDFSSQTEFYGGLIAAIDHSVCVNCGICADKCRFEAIEFKNDRFMVNELDCEGCGYCALVCPESAITMNSRKSGVKYISNTRLGNKLVHARLDIGAENSGKLVASVKNEAKSIAQEQNRRFVLVDGPPGIGCPVISSLAGANYVVLVTEPTLSAFLDLQRAVMLVSKSNIRLGCIINKYDLNPEISDKIAGYLMENHIDHLADLPFDFYFTQVMLEGKTVAETQSPFRNSLEKVWNDIQIKINIK